MTPSDSPEFLAILERVPRWHMLTADKDKWIEGDEYWHRDFGGWVAENNDQKFMVDVNLTWPARRPIPEHVRRSEAWWALLHKICQVSVSLGPLMDVISDWCWYQDQLAAAEIKHGPKLAPLHAKQFRNTLFKNFHDKEKLILGGEVEIIKNLQEGPGAYMRWVLNV